MIEAQVRRKALAYDNPGQRLPPWEQAWWVLSDRTKVLTGVDIRRSPGQYDLKARYRAGAMFMSHVGWIS